MIGGLRTYGPMRLALVGVVFVLLAAWAGIALFAHNGYPDGPSVAGTPQQVAAAQAAFATLPGVTGGTVDPYDTACRQPRSYCLSSTTLTPTQLTSEALALLKSRGATINDNRCATEQPGQGIQCSATLHWPDARLRLTSNAFVSLQPDPKEPTTLDVTVDNFPAVGGHPGTALPAWSAVNPLPAAWGLEPPCISTGPEGCLQYFVNSTSPTSVAGDLDTVTATAAQTARADGFSTSTFCRPAKGRALARCSVSLWKYRALGGRDGMGGVVTVQRLSATTVGVSVSLGALIG